MSTKTARPQPLRRPITVAGTAGVTAAVTAAITAMLAMLAAAPASAATNTFGCPGGNWNSSNVCFSLGRPAMASDDLVIYGGPTNTALLLMNVVGISNAAANSITIGGPRTDAPFMATAMLAAAGSTINAGTVNVGTSVNANANLTLSFSTLNGNVNVGGLDPNPTTGVRGYGSVSVQDNSRINGNVNVLNGQLDLYGGSISSINTLNGTFTDQPSVVLNIAGNVGQIRSNATQTNIGATQAALATPVITQVQGFGSNNSAYSGLNFVGRSTIGWISLQSGSATFRPGSNVNLTGGPGSADWLDASTPSTVTFDGTQVSGRRIDLYGTSRIGGSVLTVSNVPGVQAASFVNYGALTVSANTSSTITGPTLVNTGTITLEPSAVLSMRGGTVQNSGTIQIGGMLPGGAVGELKHDGLNNSGSLRGSGTFSSSATLTQQATGFVFAESGDLVIESRFDGRAGGTVGSGAQGRLFFYDDASFKAGQTITTANTSGPLVAFSDRVDIGSATERGGLGFMLARAAFQPSSNLVLDFAGVTDHDFLAAGSFSFEDGALTLSTAGSFTAQAGSSFNVFRTPIGTTGRIFGTFSSINSAGFNLAPGATLNFSSLYSTGTVAVVPEPATWLSLAAGLLLIGARLQRRRAVAAVKN